MIDFIIFLVGAAFIVFVTIKVTQSRVVKKTEGKKEQSSGPKTNKK